LNLVRGLLDKHVYWSQFFASLEQHTSKEVFFTNFSMSGTESVILTAVGQDYVSVAEQLVAFQEATDFIRSVRINSGSAIIDQEVGDYAGVDFTANLDFVPGVFLNPIE